MIKQTSGPAPIILKIFLLIIGIIGQCAAPVVAGDFMAGTKYMFYTNLSNVCIMAVIAVLLAYDIMRLFRGSSAPTEPHFLQTLRFMFTVAITLTFLVFSVLLTPQMIMEGHAEYLTGLSNLCVHNLVPILAIIDWCLYAWPYSTSKHTFWLGAITPLLYTIYALGCSFLGIEFGMGRRVPYFFLDYEKNGWFNLSNGQFGVVYWILILAGGILLMSIALIAIKNKVAAKHLNTPKA